MMDLVQQARYLASNSGGSWFNSAFSYQVSKTLIPPQLGPAMPRTAQESRAPRRNSWQPYLKLVCVHKWCTTAQLAFPKGWASAGELQQPVTTTTAVGCHVLCRTLSLWRPSLGLTCPHRT